MGYVYDSLNRVSTRTLTVNGTPSEISYVYTGGGHGTGSTTAMVYVIKRDGEAFISYYYDDVGNITRETMQGYNTYYAYDKLSQLIRVNDQRADQTWTFEYDRGGNITEKNRYAYTTGTLGTALETISYTYDDTNWKDKLTSYNGTAISYDDIGNPLSDGAWTYEWKAGRQLASKTKTGITAAFDYNADGLRVRKTVNGTVTEYTLNGKQVVHLKKFSHNLHFFYDAQGRPAIVEFDGVKYGYVHNLQGDIVAIIDGSGNQVVEYTYDAWGKPLTRTGTLASTLGYWSPFRYRGYVYDEETGLYYLRSRYYNPVWGRFLNADIVLGKMRKLLSHNLYVYCNNCVSSYCDPSGNIPIAVALIPTLISAAASTLSLLITSAIAPIAAAVSDAMVTSATEDITSSYTNVEEGAKKNKVDTTMIYRTGSGNYTNLTPRDIDITGLSFTTTQPLMGDYSFTTMEAVNATGVLIAVQDGPRHVSVLPTDMDRMQEWIDSRPTALSNPHQFTLVLSGIITKVR